MKRKSYVIIILIVVMIVSTIATGCNNGSGKTNGERQRTITDMAGNLVALPESVERYVVLWVGATDIAAMLDRCEHMVGCNPTAVSYPLFMNTYNSEQRMTVFENDTATVEGVLETGAQVVFYRGADHEALAGQLRKAGIAAIDVEFNDYEQMKDAITLMAEVFNSTDAKRLAAEYCEYADAAIQYADRIADSIPNGEKKTVIVIRDNSSLRAYGAQRFAGQWVALCGGEYILHEGDPAGYVNLTREQLLEYNPDYIFFVIPGEADKFLSDSRWSTLSAVKNNRVYENPYGLNTWSNHGVECVLQFQWAIETIYPEYSEFDLRDVVKKFYINFYGMELSDEEIDLMITAG